MVTFFMLIMGLSHLVNVDLAPAPLTHSRVDSFQTPVLDNRFNLDDRRQNWGVLINRSIYTENENINYNRPITIPRVSKSSPIPSAEIVKAKPRTDTKPEILFKPKRFVEKTPVVNGGLEVTNNVPKKTPLQCDIARIKCCMNKADSNNCPKASECLKLENNSNLCEAKVLQGSLRRVLDLF